MPTILIRESHMETINPYTFVELGTNSPHREQPSGHAKQDGNHLSGSFRVKITAESPLLLGAIDGTQPPKDSSGTTLIIPGSTLAGSVRAMHEALTNSCLRVVDLDYTPVHRQVVSSQTRDLQMALVTSVSDGLPDSVLLATKNEGRSYLKINSRSLDPKTKSPGEAEFFRTGDRLTIPAHAIPKGRRLKIDRASWHWDRDPGTTGDWVLLISDTKARAGEAWFAVGHFPMDGEPVPVKQDARIALARSLESADDMRPSVSLEAVGDRYVKVRQPTSSFANRLGPVVGLRLRVRSDMFKVGTPVWVLVGEDNEVTDIRISQVWRRPGAGRMKERLGAWSPCHGSGVAVDAPETRSIGRLELCPTCRLFGAAGVEDDSRERGEQDSYRGHVRFEDALLVPVPTVGDLTTEVKRADLMAPKPTAGQFYLVASRHSGDTSRDQPLAHWGSSADVGTVRAVAGRKFYWATNSNSDQIRGTKPDGEQITLVRPGATFACRVYFDNVSPSQLGSLIAAADPSRVLKPDPRATGTEARIVGRLGGGRPFGWGAVSMSIDDLVVDNPGSRYLGEDRPAETAATAIRHFRNAVKRWFEVDPAQSPTWRGLGSALTLNYVNGDKVSYPVDRTGNPFVFWQRTNGFEVYKDGVPDRRPLTGLPAASASPEEQELDLEVNG